ncbi:histidine phosphatase family protein [Ruminococcus sp.]|uniref:histidine phosphatase family protein n=1 Tax=Ruminococcus sp. TaxID=41978 RepID=UPI003438223F
MTNIYFVRHAQPDHSYADAALRPLTEEGMRDTIRVVEAMKDIHLDYAISSPYKRSYDTIKQTAIVSAAKTAIIPRCFKNAGLISVSVSPEASV